MSDYTADLREDGCTVCRQYATGTELQVRVSAGFVMIQIDGDTVFHRHRSAMSELPDHLAELEGDA